MKRGVSKYLTGAVVLCLMAGAPGLQAAERFQGAYQGVYLGYNSVADRHYCYVAEYEVDGSGGLTGTKFQSTQDVGTSMGPLAISSDYVQALREKLLLGTTLPVTARSHGRLRDDLEAGVSTALYTYGDWYLGLFALAYSGPALSNSDLIGYYWTARCGYFDNGVDQMHWAGFGDEFYNGVGGMALDMEWDTDMSDPDPMVTPASYNLGPDGYITREASDTGYYLDGGDLLVFSDVTDSTHWTAEFSLRKPTPGSSGPGMLLGRYWIGYYRYEIPPPSEPPLDPNYGVLLSEVIFDGVGGATMYYAFNSTTLPGTVVHYKFSFGYTVDANGRFNMGVLTGGLSPDGRTVVGASMGGDAWGCS